MNLFQRFLGGKNHLTRSRTTSGRRPSLEVESLEARTLMSGTPIKGIELWMPSSGGLPAGLVKLSNQQILGQMQTQFNNYSQQAANFIDSTYCPLGGDYTGASVSTLFNSPNVKVDATINPSGSVAVEMLIPISGSFKYDVRGPLGTDLHDFKWNLSAEADVKFTLASPNQGSVGNVTAAVSVVNLAVTGGDNLSQAIAAVAGALGKIPSSTALPPGSFADPLDFYFALLHNEGYQSIGVRIDSSDGMLEYYPGISIQHLPPISVLAEPSAAFLIAAENAQSAPADTGLSLEQVHIE
jgi:hypothetical protein